MDALLEQVIQCLRRPDDKHEQPARMRLALLLGVNFYTVEHWRTGRRPVGVAMRKELALILEDITHA